MKRILPLNRIDAWKKSSPPYSRILVFTERRIPHGHSKKQPLLFNTGSSDAPIPLQDITFQDVEQVISVLMDRILWYCFRSQTTLLLYMVSVSLMLL